MAPPKPYHPRVMRPATLAVLVALTLVMLALVEVSIRKLPAAISTTSDVQELRVSSSSSSSSVTHRFSSATITNLRREAPVSSSLLPIPKTRATGLYPAYTKSENEDLVSFTLTSRYYNVPCLLVVFINSFRLQQAAHTFDGRQDQAGDQNNSHHALIRSPSQNKMPARRRVFNYGDRSRLASPG